MGSITYSYKNRFRAEQQQYYITGGEGESLIPTTDFDFRYSTYRATLGAVGNLAYRFSGSHRRGCSTARSIDCRTTCGWCS